MFQKCLGFESALGNDSKTATTTTTQTFATSWYRSSELFELERRAIFSKHWLLVTHQLRFASTGDWVRFEEAGFSFILCRDKEGNINGFHNVCRHRAFPVVTKDEGRARIFSCAYHGWSYGINGKLAKAPDCQDMEGFDKARNGLLPVHVHVDLYGFIWVNLAVSKKHSMAWSESLEGLDLGSRFGAFDVAEYRFVHTWKQSCDQNWKKVAEGYNESDRYSTSCPDAADVSDVFRHTEVRGTNDSLPASSRFCFPNAYVTVASSFFYIMRWVPTSATHCSMEYEIYRREDASDEEFEKLDSMLKRSAAAGIWSGFKAQQNHHACAATSSFQDTMRELLNSHQKQEEALGRRLWPARQIITMDEIVSTGDEEFCASLTCRSRHDVENLEW